MSGKHPNPEQKKVLHLYSAFGASLVLTLVPSVVAATVGLLFFTGVLIAAYVMRGSSEDGSLCKNHASFIIRTIWIGSLFALVTLAAGSAYMLSAINYAPLHPCEQALMSGAAGIAQSGDVTALINLMRPCVDNFIDLNEQVFMISLAITALPVLLYFIVRFSRGLSRALKGYRISNSKTWF